MKLKLVTANFFITLGELPVATACFSVLGGCHSCIFCVGKKSPEATMEWMLAIRLKNIVLKQF